MNVLLQRVVDGATLDAEESARAFDAIMTGQVEKPDLAAFLGAQAARGPTVAEIVGAARAMRSHMKTVRAPDGTVDLCGTGGDGHNTLNISTAASFVVAGAGVPVAKHGNRSATSRAGAADVLEALGVRIDIDTQTAERCLSQAGVCFLFAQFHHPAMKHVAEVRREIGTRTIFNLLGPLCNPAGVRRQLIGVYAREWVEPLARVLLELGAEHAWIVHGADGLDEMTTTEATHVAILKGGDISLRDVLPEEAGIARASIADIKGGDALLNAKALRQLLEGDAHRGYHDIVALNSAAALMVAGKARDLPEGVEIANESIRGGRALAAFNSVVAATHRYGP